MIAARGAGAQERQVQWFRSNWPDEPGEMGSWRPVGYRRDALAELGAELDLAKLDEDAEALLIRSLARKGVLVGRVPATIVDRSPQPGELSVPAGLVRGAAWAEIDLALAGPHPIPVRKHAQRLFIHLKSGHSNVPRTTLASAAAGYAARLALGKPGEGWAIAGWPARTIGFVRLEGDDGLSIAIARFDLAGGYFRAAEAVPLPNIPIPERVDARAAHHLRDQLELAIGVQVDEVIFFDSSLTQSWAALRDTVRQGGFFARATEWQRAIASTMVPFQLVALLLRLASLPEGALTKAVLDPDLPIGAAVTVALQLPVASSMRDRLRTISWA